MIKCTRNNNRNIQYKGTLSFENLLKVPYIMNFLGLHLFSLINIKYSNITIFLVSTYILNINILIFKDVCIMASFRGQWVWSICNAPVKTGQLAFNYCIPESIRTYPRYIVFIEHFHYCNYICRHYRQVILKNSSFVYPMQKVK